MSFYQPPCAMLNPQVFARVKATLSRLWAELKQSEAYKEFLFWLHNAGKAEPADSGWLFGFSSNELDAYRFVIANGLYLQNSSWAVAWVNENRIVVMRLRLEVKEYFTRQQARVFRTRTGTELLGYQLHCTKRFVTAQFTEGPPKLAAQAMGVQTPEIIKKFAAKYRQTVEQVNEKIAKYKKQFPEETELSILYDTIRNTQNLDQGSPPPPLWEVIFKQASRVVDSTKKPLGVDRAKQIIYETLTGTALII